jgi:hypothetical protein
MDLHFCSLSLSESILLIRGRLHGVSVYDLVERATHKLVGSLLKVMSSDFKNLFIPVNRPSGLNRQSAFIQL